MTRMGYGAASGFRFGVLLAACGLIAGLATAQVIVNPSFEADTFTTYPGYYHQGGNGPITGWTSGGGISVGLNPSNGSPFANNGAIPDGSKVAFIQTNNNIGNSPLTLSQNVSGFTPGETYRISYRYNMRNSYARPTHSLSLGGSTISPATVPVVGVGGGNPYYYAAWEATAGAGTQNLVFQSSTTGGDGALVLDDVRITPANSNGLTLAAWTNDASAGVVTNRGHSVAANVGDDSNAVINGLTFQATGGGSNPSGTGFTTAGLTHNFSNDNNSLTSLGGPGSAVLARDFKYRSGGGTETFTFTGLRVGEDYVANFYTVGWDADFRNQIVSDGVGGTVVVNQDVLGNNNGLRLSYRYTATSDTQSFDFTSIGNRSFHNYGFSNQQAFLAWDSGAGADQSWANGANWDALDNATIPDAATPAYIDNGGTALVNGGTASAAKLTVGGVGPGTLDFRAGTLDIPEIELATGGELRASNTTLQNINSVITGVGSLVRDPSAPSNSALQLFGANTYSGGTTVDGGVLRMRHASAIGSGDLVINPGGSVQLWWNSGSSTLANDVIINSASGANNKSALYADGGGAGHGLFTLSGQITLNHAESSLGGHTINNQLVTGLITGPGGLVKGGSRGDEDSTLTIAGNDANDYAGATVLQRGNLILDKPDGVTAIPGSLTLGGTASNRAVLVRTDGANQLGGQNSVITFNNGTQNAKFQLHGNDQVVGGLVSVGNLSIVQNTETEGGIGAATLTLDVAAGETYNFDRYLRDRAGGGSGNLSLIKDGPGRQILGGNQITYSGTTRINEGPLRITSNNGLGAGGFSATTKTDVFAGGALELQGNLSVNEHLKIRGDGVGGTGAIRNLSGNSSITTNMSINSDVTFGVDADQLSINAIIYQEGGTFGITKVGGGTLQLSGANSYAGGTTVDAGTVVSNRDRQSQTALNQPGALGAANAANVVTVNNGGVLTGNPNNWFAWTDNTNPANIPSLVINDGGLVRSSNGTGRVTSLGNLTLNGGTLQSNGGWNSWGTYVLQGDVTVGGSAPSLIQTTTGSHNYIRLDHVGGSRTFDVADATGDAGVDLTVDTALYDSRSSGDTELLKTGAGTMRLTQPNQYTGRTVVNEGTLTMAGNRTANAGVIVVGNGPQAATLNIENGNFSQGNVFQVGVANAGNDAVVNQSGGSVSLTGTQLIVGNGTNGNGEYNLSGGTLTGAASGARGVILGVNTGTTGVFNLSGTGNLDLSSSNLQVARSENTGANTTTGVFNQSGGTATVNVLGVGGLNGTNNANSQGTLNLTGGSFTANSINAFAGGNNSSASITIGGTADVTLPEFPTARGTGATSTITFDGGTLKPTAATSNWISNMTAAEITNNGANIEIPAGRDATIPQVLSDAAGQTGGLNKSGPGTLTLSGQNAYTGATTVTEGTLQLAPSAIAIADASFQTPNFGNGGWSYNPGGAVWTFNAASGIANNNSPWFGGAAPDGDQAGFLQSSTALITQSINVPVDGDYVIDFMARGRNTRGPNGVIVEIDNVPVGTWAGTDFSQAAFEPFSTTASLSAGSRLLGFRGNNTIGGDRATAIDAVQVGLLGGQLPATTDLNLAGASAVLDLNGSTQTIGSLSGVAGSSIIGGSLVTGGNNSDTTFAGVMSGNGGLTKVGNGVQTLTGDNSYTGPTMITGGTLLINGAHTGNGLITVASGGTLGGSGSAVNAPVLVQGTLSPGNSPDIIGPFPSFDFAAGSSYDWEILDGNSVAGPTGWDRVDVAGAFTIADAADFTIDVDGTVAFIPDSAVLTNGFTIIKGYQSGPFDIVDYGTFSITSGTLNDIQINAGPFAEWGYFTLVDSGTTLDLYFTATIPEPGTWITFLLLGLGGIGVIRRRGQARKQA